ncbi:putative involved in protein N-glycosylation [Lyophyllum shimeji]|uniref:UDP-N-acetylglucosamine transferase subunit ALG14 n=1 Tax=Lyophyllum shimeji TaxID=47721 RepID=A0A9P3PL62_LYOSH|nr:putative involved in protein N-glycosylation [Lyophyllum shimeji]
MSLSLFVLLVLLAALVRIYWILPSANTTRGKRKRSTEPRSLAVFLGSGGHTTEALALVSALDFSRYIPRTYIISQGDNLSAQKAASLELTKGVLSTKSKDEYTILKIPRARRVHQSLLTTPPTAVVALVACIYHIVIAPFFRKGRPVFADVLLVNGPGTCFTLCLGVYVNKFFGLPASQIIYVESFARVKSLSLSGRLLRPLADRFVVQWPQLLQYKGRGEYHGWLV